MKILMVNVPYSGHVNPTLPLTKELVKRGHEVAYINSEEFRAKIEDTGATFVPYSDFPIKMSAEKKKCTCFQAAYDTALALTESFDLFIYEMFFYPGIEIARKKGIPCVRQFSQPAWSKASATKASLFFRLCMKLIDVQVMGKKKAKYMGLEHKNLGEAVIYDKPDLNIVYVPEQFQNERETFDATYIFLAPKQTVAHGKSDIPYDKMKHPIVYISLGSIISNRGFCKECIRAFGGKECSVILNTGKIVPASLGRIPENIYAYSFVPQIEVLEHTDVFLTHCGMNSVNEAMFAGVPMVVMPFINDQLNNAKQLVKMGLGKRVRSFPSSGKEIYKAVQAVYNSADMKEKAVTIKNEMAKQPTWDYVIEKIEDIANQ